MLRTPVESKIGGRRAGLDGMQKRTLGGQPSSPVAVTAELRRLTAVGTLNVPNQNQVKLLSTPALTYFLRVSCV